MDNEMQKKFDALVEKLTKKRKVLFVTLINENKTYEKRIKEAKEELKKNNELGLTEKANINKEELLIFTQSFSKNLYEMNILTNLLYGNIDFKNN
jgi:hypothetical protein